MQHYFNLQRLDENFITDETIKKIDNEIKINQNFKIKILLMVILY